MKKTTLLSILFIIIFLACKKGLQDKQAQTTAELTEKFFKLPANIKPEAQRVYDYLKAKNDEKEFVTHFVNTQGLLDWSKAIVSNKHNITAREASNEEPVYVEIPLTETSLAFAKGFLIAKETEQSLDLLLVNSEKYKSLLYGDVMDNTLNAEDLIIKLMAMNKELYGIDDFTMLDNKLFGSLIPNVSSLNGTYKVGNLKITSMQQTSTGMQRLITSSINLTYYTWGQICPYLSKGELCDGQKFCDKCVKYCAANEGWILHYVPATVVSWLDSPDKDWTDYGGDSGGGGSTGTSTGTSTNTDCDPLLSYLMRIFKPCEPNNKPITLMTEDEIIDANIIIDSTTKNSRTECLINKLRKNAFAKSLLATFDGNNKNALTFSIGNTGSDWGITRGFNDKKYTITMSKKVDSISSNIAIITSLVHELIHARMFYEMEQIGYLHFDATTGDALLNTDTTGGVNLVNLDTMSTKDKYSALINSYLHNYVKKGFPQLQWTHTLFNTAYFDVKSYREKLEQLIYDMGDWNNQPVIISLTLNSTFPNNWENKVSEYLSWQGLELTPEYQTFLQTNNITYNDHQNIVKLVVGQLNKNCN